MGSVCRFITLPTKVHPVKAMVFPVVMYGCESSTIEKAEQRIDAFDSFPPADAQLGKPQLAAGEDSLGLLEQT